ncbi:MAG TPA: GyrI-like domain-containing protein [Roseiarcus sp.]|nr:GyrI-like domain-containing protein [Roseiarcus sp.]
MREKAFARPGIAAAVSAALLALTWFGGAAAQENPPTASPTAPSPANPAAPAAGPQPAPPATTGENPSAPAPSASSPSAPTSPSPANPSSDNGQAPSESASQTLVLVGRPAAYIEGKANWDEGFSALMGAIGLINAEIGKAGLKSAGRPLGVFLETDDAGFRYRAMVPLESVPEGKTQLTDAIKIGQTPAGKAMKFEHRGSYEDIDSTYEAITAYLDEKGLEAENLFYEEYLNEVKSPDDPTLEVDIYVLLK